MGRPAAWRLSLMAMRAAADARRAVRAGDLATAQVHAAAAATWSRELVAVIGDAQPKLRVAERAD